MSMHLHILLPVVLAAVLFANVVVRADAIFYYIDRLTQKVSYKYPLSITKLDPKPLYIKECPHLLSKRFLASTVR